MTDPATLNALASEVEAGTGPDRDLDARVWVATHPDDWLVLFGTAGAQDYVINSIEGGSLALQPLTASVDAALGLMREVLQGRTLHTDEYLDGSGYSARLANVDKDGWPLATHHGRAPTLPRAIAAAVLRAVAGEG